MKNAVDARHGLDFADVVAWLVVRTAVAKFLGCVLLPLAGG